MSEPFIGEIRLFSSSFNIRGWLPCDGSLHPISQYTALYSLLATNYGGDGTTTFAVPDLRGTVPMGQNDRYPVGMRLGVPEITLEEAHLPAHSHAMKVKNKLGDKENPLVLCSTKQGRRSVTDMFSTAAPNATMRQDVVAPAGSQSPEAHENRQPFLVSAFHIAFEGLYPNRP